MVEHILFFHSKEILKNDIIWGLLELGVDCEQSAVRITLDYFSEELLEQVLSSIQEYSDTQLVMSQDFSPVLAEAAHQLGIPYLAWLYDCVQGATFRRERLYDTNFLVTFDREDQSEMIKRGIPHVLYSPLAANVTRVSSLQISDEDLSRFGADISFVGSLYHKEAVDRFLGAAPSDMQQLFLEAFNRSAFHWDGENNYRDSFDEKLVQYIKEIHYIHHEEAYRDFPFNQLAETLLLAPAIACQERSLCLKMLSELFHVRLYTGDAYASTVLPTEMIFPPVDVETDLYKVYFASKINLAFTIKTIPKGLPQRIYDIMSVGGFVLSNYQEDAEELFVPEKELVFFKTVEELQEKCFYYLKHDTERQRIGIAGYQRVKDSYSYPIVLKKILEKIPQ